MNLDQNHLNQPVVPAAFADHDALPPGTRFGEFEILRVLGVGGFGIVYLARDHSLERQVALKEYMPASLAARGHGPMITLRSDSFAETYALGLRSFINEARLLARFDHPSLVNVYRFWEDNATAYMVMPYLQGITLRDARRGMTQPPDEEWVRGVLDPMLDALEQLHREGVFHRDIAPDNILLPPEGPPILLDFGAARHVLKDRTQSLTAFLKPSYAPIEQYAEMDTMRQGPWTDIYALGAVMHYLLFGVPPAPSIARAVQGDEVPIEARVVSGVSPHFMRALAWMLGVRPLQRPQSVTSLRAALNGYLPIPSELRSDAVVAGDTAPGSASKPPLATGPAHVPEEPTVLLQRPASSSTGIDAPHQPTMPINATTVPIEMASSASMHIDAPYQRTVPMAAPAPIASDALPTRPNATVIPPARSMPPGSIPVFVAVGRAAGQRGAPRASPAVPSAETRARALRRDFALAGVAATAAIAVAALWQPADLASAPRPESTRVAGVARAASAVGDAPVAAESGRGLARAASATGNVPAAPASGASAARPKPKSKPKPVAPVALAALAATTALAAGPTSAREACAGKTYIALALCIDRECERPRFHAHPECVRALEVKRLRAER